MNNNHKKQEDTVEVDTKPHLQCASFEDLDILSQSPEILCSRGFGLLRPAEQYPAHAKVLYTAHPPSGLDEYADDDAATSEARAESILNAACAHDELPSPPVLISGITGIKGSVRLLHSGMLRAAMVGHCLSQREKSVDTTSDTTTTRPCQQRSQRRKRRDKNKAPPRKLQRVERRTLSNFNPTLQEDRVALWHWLQRRLDSEAHELTQKMTERYKTLGIELVNDDEHDNDNDDENNENEEFDVSSRAALSQEIEEVVTAASTAESLIVGTVPREQSVVCLLLLYTGSLLSHNGCAAMETFCLLIETITDTMLNLPDLSTPLTSLSTTTASFFCNIVLPMLHILPHIINRVGLVLQPSNRCGMAQILHMTLSKLFQTSLVQDIISEDSGNSILEPQPSKVPISCDIKTTIVDADASGSWTVELPTHYAEQVSITFIEKPPTCNVFLNNNKVKESAKKLSSGVVVVRATSAGSCKVNVTAHMCCVVELSCRRETRYALSRALVTLASVMYEQESEVSTLFPLLSGGLLAAPATKPSLGKSILESDEKQLQLLLLCHKKHLELIRPALAISAHHLVGFVKENTTLREAWDKHPIMRNVSTKLVRLCDKDTGTNDTTYEQRIALAQFICEHTVPLMDVSRPSAGLTMEGVTEAAVMLLQKTNINPTSVTQALQKEEAVTQRSLLATEALTQALKVSGAADDDPAQRTFLLKTLRGYLQQRRPLSEETTVRRGVSTAVRRSRGSRYCGLAEQKLRTALHSLIHRLFIWVRRTRSEAVQRARSAAHRFLRMEVPDSGFVLDVLSLLVCLDSGDLWQLLGGEGAGNTSHHSILTELIELSPIFSDYSRSESFVIGSGGGDEVRAAVAAVQPLIDLWCARGLSNASNRLEASSDRAGLMSKSPIISEGQSVGYVEVQLSGTQTELQRSSLVFTLAAQPSRRRDMLAELESQLRALRSDGDHNIPDEVMRLLMIRHDTSDSNSGNIEMSKSFPRLSLEEGVFMCGNTRMPVWQVHEGDTIGFAVRAGESDSKSIASVVLFINGVHVAELPLAADVPPHALHLHIESSINQNNSSRSRLNPRNQRAGSSSTTTTTGNTTTITINSRNNRDSNNDNEIRIDDLKKLVVCRFRDFKYGDAAVLLHPMAHSQPTLHYVSFTALSIMHLLVRQARLTLADSTSTTLSSTQEQLRDKCKKVAHSLLCTAGSTVQDMLRTTSDALQQLTMVQPQEEAAAISEVSNRTSLLTRYVKTVFSRDIYDRVIFMQLCTANAILQVPSSPLPGRECSGSLKEGSCMSSGATLMDGHSAVGKELLGSVLRLIVNVNLPPLSLGAALHVVSHCLSAEEMGKSAQQGLLCDIPVKDIVKSLLPRTCNLSSKDKENDSTAFTGQLVFCREPIRGGVIISSNLTKVSVTDETACICTKLKIPLVSSDNISLERQGSGIVSFTVRFSALSETADFAVGVTASHRPTLNGLRGPMQMLAQDPHMFVLTNREHRRGGNDGGGMMMHSYGRMSGSSGNNTSSRESWYRMELARHSSNHAPDAVFQSGDYITVRVDTIRRSVSFERNGRPLGSLFINIPATVKEFEGSVVNTMHNAPVVLVPVVLLSQASVQLESPCWLDTTSLRSICLCRRLLELAPDTVASVVESDPERAMPLLVSALGGYGSLSSVQLLCDRKKRKKGVIARIDDIRRRVAVRPSFSRDSVSEGGDLFCEPISQVLMDTATDESPIQFGSDTDTDGLVKEGFPQSLWNALLQRLLDSIATLPTPQHTDRAYTLTCSPTLLLGILRAVVTIFGLGTNYGNDKGEEDKTDSLDNDKIMDTETDILRGLTLLETTSLEKLKKLYTVLRLLANTIMDDETTPLTKFSWDDAFSCANTLTQGGPWRTRCDCLYRHSEVFPQRDAIATTQETQRLLSMIPFGRHTAPHPPLESPERVASREEETPTEKEQDKTMTLKDALCPRCGESCWTSSSCDHRLPVSECAVYHTYLENMCGLESPYCLPGQQPSEWETENVKMTLSIVPTGPEDAHLQCPVSGNGKDARGSFSLKGVLRCETYLSGIITYEGASSETAPAGGEGGGDQWACTACTYLNLDSSSTRCDICGTSRPGVRKCDRGCGGVVVSGVCTRCGGPRPTVVACETCGHTRNVSFHSFVAKAGCPRCHRETTWVLQSPYITAVSGYVTTKGDELRLVMSLSPEVLCLKAREGSCDELRALMEEHAPGVADSLLPPLPTLNQLVIQQPRNTSHSSMTIARSSNTSSISVGDCESLYQALIGSSSSLVCLVGISLVRLGVIPMNDFIITISELRSLPRSFLKTMINLLGKQTDTVAETVLSSLKRPNKIKRYVVPLTLIELLITPDKVNSTLYTLASLVSDNSSTVFQLCTIKTMCRILDNTFDRPVNGALLWKLCGASFPRSPTMHETLVLLLSLRSGRCLSKHLLTGALFHALQPVLLIQRKQPLPAVLSRRELRGEVMYPVPLPSTTMNDMGYLVSGQLRSSIGMRKGKHYFEVIAPSTEQAVHAGWGTASHEVQNTATHVGLGHYSAAVKVNSGEIYSFQNPVARTAEIRPGAIVGALLDYSGSNEAKVAFSVNGVLSTWCVLPVNNGEAVYMYVSRNVHTLGLEMRMGTATEFCPEGFDDHVTHALFDEVDENKEMTYPPQDIAFYRELLELMNERGSTSIFTATENENNGNDNNNDNNNTTSAASTSDETQSPDALLIAKYPILQAYCSEHPAPDALQPYMHHLEALTTLSAMALPVIDLTQNFPHLWKLGQLVRELQLYRARHAWFSRQLQAIINVRASATDVHIDFTDPKDTNLITMQLFRGSHRLNFRQKTLMTIKGAHATDGGGVLRTVLSMVASELSYRVIHGKDNTSGEIKEPLAPLFCLARHQTRRYVVPNMTLLRRQQAGSSSGPWRLQEMYTWLGKLMGHVMFSGALPIPLPRLIWKKLLRQETTIEDYSDEIDASPQNDLYNREFMISDEFFERFPGVERYLLKGHTTAAVATGDVVHTPLVSPGTPVGFPNQDSLATAGLHGNKRTDTIFQRRYNAAIQLLLSEFDEAIELIRSGLEEVIPQDVLKQLRWKELERLVCGTSVKDSSEILKQMDTTDVDPEVLAAFTAALQKLNPDQWSEFLVFATGQSRLPLPSLIKVTVDDRGIVVPTAHTCLPISLVLPNTNSAEKMLSGITMALAEKTQFGFV